MKHIIKKISCITLTAALLVGGLPVYVSAENPETQQTQPEEIPTEEGLTDEIQPEQPQALLVGGLPVYVSAENPETQQTQPEEIPTEEGLTDEIQPEQPQPEDNRDTAGAATTGRQ